METSYPQGDCNPWSSQVSPIEQFFVLVFQTWMETSTFRIWDLEDTGGQRWENLSALLQSELYFIKV